jgi:hypothetical protein
MTDVQDTGDQPLLVPWLQDLPLPPDPSRRAATGGSLDAELPAWLDGIAQLPAAAAQAAAGGLPA